MSNKNEDILKGIYIFFDKQLIGLPIHRLLDQATQIIPDINISTFELYTSSMCVIHHCVCGNVFKT